MVWIHLVWQRLMATEGTSATDILQPDGKQLWELTLASC